MDEKLATPLPAILLGLVWAPWRLARRGRMPPEQRTTRWVGVWLGVALFALVAALQASTALLPEGAAVDEAFSGLWGCRPRLRKLIAD